MSHEDRLAVGLASRYNRAAPEVKELILIMSQTLSDRAQLLFMALVSAFTWKVWLA